MSWTERPEEGIRYYSGTATYARSFDLPPELRAPRYTVEILRDPIKGEAGDRVEESFAGQAPDVRVAMDLAKSGGFLITVSPQA